MREGGGKGIDKGRFEQNRDDKGKVGQTKLQEKI
jgi:hypothetical protein